MILRNHIISKGRRKAPLLLAVLAVSGALLLGSAGQRTRCTGAIHGVVTDSLTHDSIPFVQILLPEAGKDSIVGHADHMGLFLVHPCVKAGKRRLVVRHPGYRTWSREVELRDDRLTLQDIRLQPLP